MPTPVPTPAATLGRYTILGRIAAGGMASVYLARLADVPAGFSREFALKVIHPHLVEEDGFTARFLQEAQLASRVRHSNVVRTVDAGEDQGYAFMALELIDGVNLRQLALHRARPFSAPHAAAIVEMVARGLDAVHEATDAEGEPLGMVHRDISPHNVMLTRNGRAILIDLGLARPDRTTGLTQVGVLAGKLPYMSPEQARLEDLDGRSDIFSMGTLLFELVTGELPFGDTHSAPTMTKLDACEPGPIRAMLELHAAPQWIIDIILACLRPTREERIATAEDLADAIAQELSAAGHDTAAQCAVLATIVEDAYDTLGTVETATPLPRILTAQHPPVASAPSEPVRASVWLAAASGLAAVLALAVWTLRASPSASTRVAPQADGARSMSEDMAPQSQPEPLQARELPRSESGPSAPPAPPGPIEVETPALEPGPEPRPPRGAKRAPKSPDPDGLKPNPYENP